MQSAAIPPFLTLTVVIASRIQGPAVSTYFILPVQYRAQEEGIIVKCLVVDKSSSVSPLLHAQFGLDLTNPCRERNPILMQSQVNPCVN